MLQVNIGLSLFRVCFCIGAFLISAADDGLVKGFVVFSGKEDVLMKKKDGFSNPALEPVRSLHLVFCVT